MTYDPKKHHRKSIRLKGYNYSQAGMYYVVARTKKGECVLGEVVENEMKLSAVGKVAHACWLEIPQHFKNAGLDIFQVMPNHVHGIIIIRFPLVRTRHAVSLRDKALKDRLVKSEFGKPVSGSLSTVVRSFKSAVTKSAHLAGYKDFGWHGRFYEHVIRDGNDLDRIRKYILDNPTNWANDDNFPKNVRMDRIFEGFDDWSPLG